MSTQAPSTKDFVEIVDIRESVAILKNGSLRSIIEVGAVNFDLKEAGEQEALIDGFKNFLNSLDFPLQIVISSRRLDIRPYIKSLEDMRSKVNHELLRIQLNEYIRFIKGLTELANIVAKKFYIVVPFYIIETASSGASGFFSSIKSILNPKKFAQSITDQQFEQYRVQLDERISLILGAVNGLSLQGRVLESNELQNMYYNYYNPGQQLSQ